MDPVTTSQQIAQHLTLFVTFGALALVISWIAWILGYYKLPCKTFPGPQLGVGQMVTFFVIFLVVYFVIAPFLFPLTLHLFGGGEGGGFTPIVLSTMQLILFLLMLIGFGIYMLTQNREEMQKILKTTTFPCKKSLLFDIFIGFISWFVAVSVVVAVDNLFEILNLALFNFSGAQQVAITFLVQSAENPLSLFLAVFTIVILAPVVEEFLFRGVLFNWLRTRYSLSASIIYSSLLFAFFHYSSLHSYGNIPLIASLFVFACYLSFVYERQRSLIAPITLHVTFNAISVINILLLM